METRGAFPGWLNRCWRISLPGMVFVASIFLYITVYVLAIDTKYGATGISAIAGEFVSQSIGWRFTIVGSWLLVSVVVTHLWLLIALGIALRRSTYMTGWERCQLAATGVMLLAFYSPLVAFGRP